MNVATLRIVADMWDADGHMGGGWWIVMMIGMLVFWGAVIVGIAWLARSGSPDSWRRDRRSETPIEILERRFAEGSISADEYHERREVLTGGTGRS